MTVIKCCHPLDPEPFRDGNYRRVCRTEREPSVLDYKVCHARIVGGEELFNLEFFGRQRTEETGLGLCAELGEHVADFGDYGRISGARSSLEAA
ncbi:hypothetical protein OHQ90_00755 [Nocardia sp. NBC_00403]